MILPIGYSDVPGGKLAAIVTCLEMRQPPPARPASQGEERSTPWRLRRITSADAAWYQTMFRRIGTEWLWFSRLVMTPAELDAILASPAVEIYALMGDGRDAGLLELDFRDPGQCELAFFGVTADIQGRGAGRWLMNRALATAWARPISRVWVHTCTLDHPGALSFYLRSGFQAYARRVEIADDPRLTGLIPRTAAQHVPLIEPAAAPAPSVS